MVVEGATVAGRALVLVGGQQTAAVWDVTGEPTRLLELGDDTVAYSAAWSGPTVAVGTLEGDVRRVDLTDPDAPVPLPDLSLDEPMAVTGLAMTPASRNPATRAASTVAAKSGTG